MNNLSRFEKLVAVAFVGGLLSCFFSLPVFFLFPEVAKGMFVTGGTVAMFVFIYSIIQGTYENERK